MGLLRDNTPPPRSLLSFCRVRSSGLDQVSRAQIHAQAEQQRSDVHQEHQPFQSALAKVRIPVIPVQPTSVSDIHNSCVSMLTTEQGHFKGLELLKLVFWAPKCQRSFHFMKCLPRKYAFCCQVTDEWMNPIKLTAKGLANLFRPFAFQVYSNCETDAQSLVLRRLDSRLLS